MSGGQSSSWLGGNGDWSNAADWSNGIPQSTVQSALIEASGTYAVTVAAGESLAIGGLTMNAYAATLLLDGTLAPQTPVQLDAGTLIEAGLLAGSADIGGGTLVFDSGTLHSLTPSLALNGGAIVAETTAGGTVTLATGPGSLFSGHGTIGEFITPTGSGSLAGFLPASPVVFDNQGTLVATPGVVYGSSFGTYFGDQLGLDLESLVNAGTIRADRAMLQVDALSIDNQGLIAANTGAVDLYGTLTNSGTVTVNAGTLTLGDVSTPGVIAATASTVRLDGPESLAGIRALTLQNDTIEIGGILDNVGVTLNAASTPLVGMTLVNGTIDGGAVDPAALGLSFSAYGSNVFQGVSVIDGFTLHQGHATLGSGSTVFADAGTTIGTVVVNDTTDASAVLGLAPGAGGTIAQPVEVLLGTAAVFGDATLAGSIVAAGRGAAIALGANAYYGAGTSTWVNQGTVIAGAGSTLLIGGDETAADLGSIVDAGATVELTGTYENAGATLAGGALLGVTLAGGTIAGGSVDAAALGLGFGRYAPAPGYGYHYVPASNVLAGVTVTDGLSVTSGNVTLTQGSTVLAGTQGAAGTILVDGVTASPGGFSLYPTLEIDAAAGATIAQPVDVESGTLSLAGAFTLTAPVTANGTAAVISIDSLQSGAAAPGWTNDSTITVENGATLLLGGDVTRADLGAIDNRGGTVELVGTLQNAGQVLDAGATSLVGMTLAGGTIAGGTIDPTALALHGGSYVAGTLANVVVLNDLSVGAGTLALAGSDTIDAAGTASGAGTITVGAGAGVVLAGTAAATLVNNVVLAGGALGWQESGGVAGTIAASVAVTGHGALASYTLSGYSGYRGTASLVNLGTIDATGVYQTLSVGSAYFDNQGMISAGSVAALVVGRPFSGWSNEGTITAGVGVSLALQGGFANTGLITVGGGTLVLGQAYTFSGAYGSGTFTPAWRNSGTIVATSAAVTLGGLATLADLGSIALTADTVVLDGTIDAAGALLDGTGAGSILAGATLAGGTIDGGTIDLAASGLIVGSGAIDAATMINGLTLTQGALLLEGGTRVYADGGTTLATIVVDGTTYPGASLDLLVAGGTANQAIDVLAGSATVAGDFTLAAPLAASGAGATLAVEGSVVSTSGPTPASWINLSTLSVATGAMLELGGIETVADLGAISNQGGTVVFDYGTLENTGQTLGAADTALVGLRLAGGTIAGGVIDAAGLAFAVGVPGVYSPFGGPSVLQDVAVFGTLRVDGALTLSGTSAVFSTAAETAAGAISIGSYGALVFAEGETYTLANPITLGGGSLGWTAPASVENTFTYGQSLAIDVTIAAGDMVSGYGSILDSPWGPNAPSLVNEGTIAALSNANGIGLDLGVPAMRNDGLLTAAPGATLAVVPYGLPSDWTNAGTVAAGSLGVVTLGGNFANDGLITETGGTIVLGAPVNGYVAGSFVNTSSSFVNAGTIAGTGGLIELAGDETYAALGTVRRNGAAIAIVGGTFDNTGSLLGSASTDLLGVTLAGGTIEGGTIDVAGLGLAVAPAGYGYRTAVLDNVSVRGDLSVATALTLSGTTTVDNAAGTAPGTITVAGNGLLDFAGGPDFTLATPLRLAGGSVGWSGSGGTATATIGAGVTVAGFGALGAFSTTTLVNLGAVEAGAAGMSLAIEGPAFVNRGTVIASGGGAVDDYAATGTLTGGLYEVVGRSGYSGSSLYANVTAVAATVSLSGSLASASFFYDLARIAAGGTVALANGADLYDSVSLAVDGAVSLAGGTVTAADIGVEAGGTLAGAGTVTAATIAVAGVVEATGGALALDGTVTGGPLSVAASGTLDLGGTDMANVSLLAGGAVLQLDMPGGFGGTVENFTNGDSLVLGGFQAVSETFGGGTLTVTNGGTTLDIAMAGSFAANAFAPASAPPGETVLTLASAIACFAQGTCLRTPDGWVAVEALREGDLVSLAEGGAAPVVWIGRRRLEPARHARPEAVRPVRIRAGALADGVPRRDLLLSPDHALYLDGVLVPAKALLNGRSIAQEDVAAVVYFHIETATHTAVLAEGAAAETYLDTGNRDAFEDQDAAMVLHPAFNPDAAQLLREDLSFAPLCECGAPVERIRAGLLARVSRPATHDPALRILWRGGDAVIASRSAVPGDILPDPRDRRRLGVKLAALAIDGRQVRLDDKALRDGWHDLEADGRWTDGAAVIPASLIARLAPSQARPRIRVEIAATLGYDIEPASLSYNSGMHVPLLP